jgi:hypothetical protein
MTGSPLRFWLPPKVGKQYKPIDCLVKRVKQERERTPAYSALRSVAIHGSFAHVSTAITADLFHKVISRRPRRACCDGVFRVGLVASSVSIRLGKASCGICLSVHSPFIWNRVEDEYRTGKVRTSESRLMINSNAGYREAAKFVT